MTRSPSLPAAAQTSIPLDGGPGRASPTAPPAGEGNPSIDRNTLEGTRA